MAQTKNKEANEIKWLNLGLTALALGSLAVAALTLADFFKAGTDELFLTIVALLLAVVFAIMPLKWAYENGKIFQPIADEVPAHDAHAGEHAEAHGGSNRENIVIWV